jgi:D-arabinose 1-dehydrogenase-like Zn-dependent alcohol dehydrogenase
MSLKTQTYVCKEKSAPFTLKDIELAMQINEWGVSTYPVIAGHEGVGKITKAGRLCPSFKESDLVGFGWMVKIYF